VPQWPSRPKRCALGLEIGDDRVADLAIAKAPFGVLQLRLVAQVARQR
jgi:hypothetical protein